LNNASTALNVATFIASHDSAHTDCFSILFVQESILQNGFKRGKMSSWKHYKTSINV